MKSRCEDDEIVEEIIGIFGKPYENIWIFSRIFCLVFLGFLVAFEGSDLFRKVREGAGIHFHQVSSKSDPGRPS